jgi:hypothetical protein
VIETEATWGERVADQVARLGGSWTFIILFGLVLINALSEHVGDAQDLVERALVAKPAPSAVSAASGGQSGIA